MMVRAAAWRDSAVCDGWAAGILIGAAVTGRGNWFIYSTLSFWLVARAFELLAWIERKPRGQEER